MRIGFIGTGVMGGAMARRLLEAGHDVAVYNRTAGKAVALLEHGARVARSAEDAARDAEALITIVGFPHDVRNLYLGSDIGSGKGLVAVAPTGSLLIDMTTSSPALAVRIAAAAAERGLDALDAPVSGGDVGARDGTLSIMVGGTPAAFERATPLLAGLGSRIVHQGDPGAGQHAKMSNQIAIAGTMVGLSEAMAYAKAVGLDPARLLDSIGAGAAGSWSMNVLAPRMLAGDWAPGFYIRHFIKDLGIALAEAERMAIDLPGLRNAKTLYDRLSTEVPGAESMGTQALIRLWEQHAQSEDPRRP